MWKRADEDAPPGAPAPPAAAPTLSSSETKRERAVLGPSITVRGDLHGDEDLTIQGRVEGKVDLGEQTVTIGKTGRVKANVSARVVIVEGEVEGDLAASEQILIRKSGSVRGNLVAPRVTLEDGCKFKGAIDMDPKGGAQPNLRLPNAPRAAAPPPPPPPGGTPPDANAAAGTSGGTAGAAPFGGRTP